MIVESRSITGMICNHMVQRCCKESEMSKSQVLLKSQNDKFYFVKDNIIVDKTCPQCKKILFEENDFCRCGFFIKAENTSRFWTKMLAVWLSMGFVFIVAVINLQNLGNHLSVKYKDHNMDFSSVAPLNIQILISLNNSPYIDYIQNVYIQPNEDNKLYILIKPDLWKIMTNDEKNDMLNAVKTNWTEIYKKNFPLAQKKPEASFANPE